MDRFLSWWESDTAHVAIGTLSVLAMVAFIWFQI